ncbi:hypothetical protein T01_14287 [Trichinella spiralis]|uniref:Uncharacterized protein n=1 Tax=Trichinella spiralis TaxID=6334 RepID=A0A0V1AUJ8_TRISP|nr:hypothetical protein T01_14287 [Trichinella spiralis]
MGHHAREQTDVHFLDGLVFLPHVQGFSKVKAYLMKGKVGSSISSGNSFIKEQKGRLSCFLQGMRDRMHRLTAWRPPITQKRRRNSGKVWLTTACISISWVLCTICSTTWPAGGSRAVRRLSLSMIWK